MARHHSPESSRRLAHVRAVVRWLADEDASAAVEYIGLGMVVSMLMASVAAAVDSAAGDRLAQAVIERLIGMVSGSAE